MRCAPHLLLPLTSNLKPYTAVGANLLNFLSSNFFPLSFQLPALSYELYCLKPNTSNRLRRFASNLKPLTAESLLPSIFSFELSAMSFELYLLSAMSFELYLLSALSFICFQLYLLST